MAQMLSQKKEEAEQEAVRAGGKALQKKRSSGAAVMGDNRPVQKQSNQTGMPDKLKAGVEALSGISMDHVRVHYNSDKPAQLQAHAYAQGNQIHLAPGQEKHLPHEAWHVVQQAQGRVRQTVQMKHGVAVNDDMGLEREADVMGRSANNYNDARLIVLEPSPEKTTCEKMAVQKMVTNGPLNDSDKQLEEKNKEESGAQEELYQGKVEYRKNSFVVKHNGTDIRIQQCTLTYSVGTDVKYTVERHVKCPDIMFAILKEVGERPKDEGAQQQRILELQKAKEQLGKALEAQQHFEINIVGQSGTEPTGARKHYGEEGLPFSDDDTLKKIITSEILAANFVVTANEVDAKGFTIPLVKPNSIVGEFTMSKGKILINVWHAGPST